MGDTFHNTTTSATDELFAVGYTHAASAERRVLVINKRNANATVLIQGAVSARVVDEVTGEQPPRVLNASGGVIVLGPYATAVVTLAH
jgi:hypothetical protein